MKYKRCRALRHTWDDISQIGESTIDDYSLLSIINEITQPQEFYKYKVTTNAGKQSVSYMAIDIWKDLPSSLKDLSVFVFPKYIKRNLLLKQKPEPIFHLAKFVN